MRVLLVEDEEAIARPLALLLGGEGWQTDRCATVAAALQQLEQNRFDAAVIDLGLPDGDGITVCRAARGMGNPAIIVLTARSDETSAVASLDAGADDYIVKPFLPKELTLRITAILRRVYVPIRQEQLPAFSLGDRTVDLGASLVRAQDGREWTLTAKEHALLKKLYENRNRIVTSDALCQAAWGDDLYGYENTLMVHIRRMREKLEQDPSHPQYLLTARGLGYKLQLAPTKNA